MENVKGREPEKGMGNAPVILDIVAKHALNVHMDIIIHMKVREYMLVHSFCNSK